MTERSGFLENPLNIGMWYSKPNSWFTGSDIWTADQTRYEVDKTAFGADASYALEVKGGAGYGLYLTLGGYVKLESVIQEKTSHGIETVTENSSDAVGLRAGFEARSVPFGIPVSTELSGRAGYGTNSPAGYDFTPLDLCLGITAYGVGLQAMIDGGLHLAAAPEKTAYALGILLRPTDMFAIWGQVLQCAK